VAQEGETVVYTTACAGKATGDGSFVPFQVNYAERYSAVGKTASGFNKRDGRPKDSETLKSRLIDRPLRPMLSEGWQFDTQVLSWVLSYDGENQSDALAITSAAAALLISDIPISRAVAGVRVGEIDGELVINPSLEQMAQSTLDLVLAGTSQAVLMIEGFADFLPEERMIEAVELGHAAVGRICDAMEAWAAEVGKPKRTDGYQLDPQLVAGVQDLVGAEVRDAYLSGMSKAQRAEAISALKQRCLDVFAGGAGSDDVSVDYQAYQVEKEEGGGEGGGAGPLASASDVGLAFKKCESGVMRRLVLDEGHRADGRSVTDVRPITTRCSVLPRTHGSALFTRGETQALAVATLGSEGDAQKTNSMATPDDEVSRFYLQYFFPPSSVGETGRVGAPGRRELGHGTLAERALAPAVPGADVFPYTVRVESTITESNGSSSMASVCGGCLSMLDAGVPLAQPVAGIAMGLVLEPTGEFTVLSDILGSEDALGDMDFKVAGSEDGVTAFQMDIKVEGITLDIMRRALGQAKEGRRYILGEMLRETDPARAPRRALSPLAPRVAKVEIPQEKVGAVIGPQGKTVRALQALGATIQIDSDSATVDIAAPDASVLEQTIDAINAIAAEVQVGKIYTGAVVTNLAAFGAFVEIIPGKSGLVHISELDESRVNEVADVVKEGDLVDVMVVDVKDNGKMSLSRKAALQHRKDNPGDTGLDVDSGAMIRAALRFPGAVKDMHRWIEQNGYPGDAKGE